MAQSAPQYNLRKTIDRLNTLNSLLFWTIFVLSIIPLVLPYFEQDINFDDEVNTLNIVCLILFFIVDIVIDYILTPMADSVRRDDFIDNSFGSRFVPEPSVGYFDNDDLSPGLFKAACNLFENCYFTHQLVKKLTIRRILLPAIVLTTVASGLWVSFKHWPVGLSLLQTLFSAKLLGRVIKHCILLVKLHAIENGWINLFQDSGFAANPASHDQTVYRLWLGYESLHSAIPADIPESVFKEHNTALTAKWKEIRNRYHIN